ncbi:hypothetical protein JCM6882_005465 [Rhodosporidiobolus microsporus]
MAYNGMPQIPSVSQRSLSITVSQFSSFATPAITVPFPSAYGGQTQIPFAWTDTATWAATRVPTTLGGVAATAGVHSIYSEASAAGYRTHDYGNNGGGGGGWPTWATAVIAACGGAAVVILIAGLFCWRWRRKQRARRNAQAYAAGGAAAVNGGKKRRKGQKNGGAFTEKNGDAGGGSRERRSRAAPDAAFAAVPTTSPTKSRSRSRQTGRDSPASYPPVPPGVSPSRSRARDLAALGISRPSSASPSPYSRSRHSDQPSSPSGYASPAYPAFAVPREERNHHRDFSGSSANELLPPAAGFAYAEGSGRSGYDTPPHRAPNTNWEDSPGATGSPARLLSSSHGRNGGHGGGTGGLYPESPRSSFTVSTRGTGGAPYRWDQDPDLSNHMPDADDVSAALGRAMLGPPVVADADGFEPVGVAVGSPNDAQRWARSEDYHSGEGTDGYGARQYGYGGGGGGQQAQLGEPFDRSTTPSYPPPASSSSQYSASRAPSRQTARGGAPGYLAPAPALSSHSHGGGSRSHSPANARSTTPYGEPPPLDTRRTGGGVSRASTYRTADEQAGDMSEESAEEMPSRSYARRG